MPLDPLFRSDPPRRDFLRGGLAALIALGLAAPARASATIDTLHLLCTGPAGSIPDTVARRSAEQLTGPHAQRVWVENRTGAAGQIAVNALKAAPADGSTLLLAQGAIATVYPYLYPKLAYDPALDLQPVSLAGEMTLGLAVGPVVPAAVTTVPELNDWMRRHPLLANVGSPGTGTLPHLLAAMLFQQAGVGWQHVVYAGGPPALVDLMGGQIAALVLPEGLLRQHIASGRLRVLATSGAARTAQLPEVPSLAEAGYPGLVVREWFAFFMPGRASAATVDAAAAALRSALAKPELVRAFAELGMVAASSTPAALTARITAEQRTWAQIVRATGIRAE